MGKIEPRLKELLGIKGDPPIIVEFYDRTRMDVGAIRGTGATVTGMSSSLPYVYCVATAEQVLAIERIPSVKKIWYSAPVHVYQENNIKLLQEESGGNIITLSDARRAMRVDEVPYDGSGIKVAVLDSGVCSSNPMLAGKVVEKAQIVVGDIEDFYGHGTFCASAIAGQPAITQWGEVEGIAPGAEIINVKVIDDEGSSNWDKVMQGIEKASELGADIISLSLGEEAYGCWRDYPVCKSINYYSAKGIIFCCAAGNSGLLNLPSLPAICTNCVSVGSMSLVSDSDNVSDFSSRGPACGIAYPDVSAPGGAGPAYHGGNQEIESIVGAWRDSFAPTRGTSMSTPQVAGTIALLIQAVKEKYGRKPLLHEIKNALSLSCFKKTIGKDNELGWGRVDAYALVNNFSPTPPSKEVAKSALPIPFILAGGCALIAAI